MDIKQQAENNRLFVKKNWKKPTSWLAKKLGVASRTIRQYKEDINSGRISVGKPEEQVKTDVVVRQFRQKEKHRDEKYKIVLDALERSEKALEVSLELKKANKPHAIKSHGEGGSEATAFMVASDWHVEEEVRSSQVSGVNSYTLDIAKSRADKFFSNGVKLVKIFQRDTKISNLVLPLIGDFITGNLHEDSQERNQRGTMKAIMFAQELILSGIKHLLENTNCHITIVCHSGNHGRMTKKIHWGNENQNSVEWIMYCTLANMFSDEKRVTFIIPDGDMSYLPVYNMKVRFIHGHQVKFGGGVGGLTIPMRKAIAQWDRVQQADLTVFGHFHQRIDGGNFIGNGSLIGYNAFAQAMKCEYEAPAQQFFLISNKNGGMKTVVAPIWLD